MILIKELEQKFIEYANFKKYLDICEEKHFHLEERIIPYFKEEELFDRFLNIYFNLYKSYGQEKVFMADNLKPFMKGMLKDEEKADEVFELIKEKEILQITIDTFLRAMDATARSSEPTRYQPYHEVEPFQPYVILYDSDNKKTLFNLITKEELDLTTYSSEFISYITRVLINSNSYIGNISREELPIFMTLFDREHKDFCNYMGGNDYKVFSTWNTNAIVNYAGKSILDFPLNDDEEDILGR